MQELLTVEETMERLKLKRRTVDKLVKTPDFPSYKIGGSVRIGADELEDWIKRQRIA